MRPLLHAPSRLRDGRRERPGVRAGNHRVGNVDGMNATWQNRIVGHGEVDPRELKANPQNWRLHPSHQRAAVREVLAKVGWVGGIMLNRTTGNMIDGHLRVEEAIE